MKRNLLKGIILIGAIALSSCSTTNNLSKSGIIGDDVYYTQAKAGDSYNYNAQYSQYQDNYVRNDDYYYYGDYESRINRFAYYTPFDYDDDFYYSYTPFSSYQNYGQIVNPPYDDGYGAAYDFGVYSAYDFGYGDFGGYDNFGYGAAYSTFIYNGGSRANYKKSYSYSNNGDNSTGSLVFTRANGGISRLGTGTGSLLFGRENSGIGSTGNTGLTFTRANAGGTTNSGAIFSGSRPGGSNAVYPGRPGTNSNTQVSSNNTNTRIIRPESQNPRPVIQQPTIERASPPPMQSSGSSSGSSGGAASGGGGRPVRP